MNKTIKTIIAGIAFFVLLFTGVFAVAQQDVQHQIGLEPVTLQTPAEEVSEINDKSGMIIGLALATLIALYMLFKKKAKNTQDDNTKTSELVGSSHNGCNDIEGEIYAAIAAAIHLYNEELHDEENTVLTINRISRTYSPWSSKIQGLNTYFNRR